MMHPTYVAKWRGGIAIHYGTIANFDDATTIRHIRRSCIEWLGEDVAMLLTLEPWPEDRDDWDRSFTAERSLMSFTLGACSAWLRARGLPL